MGIYDCKECYFVTEVNGEYECDCELNGGRCPLELTPDEAYAEWCLNNNWLDANHSRRNIGDFSAGIYVCGENLFDDEWKEWIEKQLCL